MKNKLCIFFLLLLSYSKSFSQFDHKATLYGFVGVPMYKKMNDFQHYHVFDGYQSLPYFGAILQYALNQHIHMGGSFRQLFTQKTVANTKYTVSATTLGLVAKYNFIPADQLISPFVSMEPNLSFMHVYNSGYDETKHFTSENKIDISEETSTIHQYENRYNLFPVLGVNFSAGTDFTVKKKYGLFISLNYFTSNSKAVLHSLLSNNNGTDDPFNQNKSTFKYFSIQTGIKFSFLRANAIY